MGHSVSIIFLRIGPPRRPQTEALLEVKTIFRRSVRSLPPALALTERRSFGSESVPGIVFLAGFHSLSPTFPLNASQNRLAQFLHVNRSPRVPAFHQDLRLGYLYLLEDVPLDNLRTVQRGTLTGVECEVASLN